MLIKQNGFQITLPQQLPSLFVINSQEIFLVEQFKQLFKQKWLLQKTNAPPFGPRDVEEVVDFNRMDVIQPTDWQQLSAYFGHYSLLTSLTVLDVNYDKKSFDAEGKRFCREYIERGDPDTLLLLYCPQLNASALKFLSDDQRAAVCTVKMPAEGLILRWIQEQLLQHFNSGTFNQSIPKLIYQYTQGNLLACYQVIQKIMIAEDRATPLSESIVQEHLQNACQYQLYDLSDACLSGDASKALLIFRYAIEHHFEPVLLLWVLAQEVRLLIQLHDLQSGATRLSFQAAANQLKIWSSRTYLYQGALKRLIPQTLNALLSQCYEIDTNIKTSQNNQLVQQFELIILSLCIGKDMNPLE